MNVQQLQVEKMAQAWFQRATDAIIDEAPVIGG